MKARIDRLAANNTLPREELIDLIQNITEEDRLYLFEKSLEAKETFYDKSVFMRGLIEISSYCAQNCSYCGIRRDNENAERYRLDVDQILACCKEGYDLGYRTFVLQGGEDPYYTDERLVELLTAVKSKYDDIAITLSLGERSYDSYKTLKEAGADRYLLRHETASKHLYESLHPDMSFENRRQCLWDLKKLGFQVGAGFMVGLPNQTAEDLVEDLLFLKELEPHMVGIGPFIPHSETPIGHNPGGTVEQTLLMLSLVRLMLPKALLPSTTALGTIDEKGREKALKVGANVVMPNLSPTDVRAKYELYENKICTGDEAAHCRACIEGRINSVGFYVDMSKGDHYEWR